MEKYHSHYIFVVCLQLRSTLNVEVKKFTIEGEGANDIFIVDEKGDLYVTTNLDREKKAFYNLTARMFDGNNKLIEDAGDFVVQVTDINDNCPEFQEEYKGSVMERISMLDHRQGEKEITDHFNASGTSFGENVNTKKTYKN